MVRADTVTFVTSNEHKIQQFEQLLGRSVCTRRLELDEPQTDQLLEVVTAKALQTWRHLKTPVLVEDTALTFHALGALPGPFIKWFLERPGSEGMCRMLDGYADRSATEQTMYAYFDGSSQMRVFVGSVKGRISQHPAGNNVPYYGDIFIPNGYSQTWAQMPADLFLWQGKRARAMQQLKPFLLSQAPVLPNKKEARVSVQHEAHALVFPWQDITIQSTSLSFC